MFCYIQSFWDTFNQGIVAGGKSLMHQSRIAADKIDAGRLRSALQSLGKFHRIFSLAGSGDHSDRGNRNAFMNNRNPIFFADVFPRLH